MFRVAAAEAVAAPLAAQPLNAGDPRRTATDRHRGDRRCSSLSISGRAEVRQNDAGRTCLLVVVVVEHFIGLSGMAAARAVVTPIATTPRDALALGPRNR